MTGDLIAGKKKATAALDAFVQEMGSGDALLQEVESSMQKWLDDLDDDRDRVA